MKMRTAGKNLAEIFENLSTIAVEGISTASIDAYIEKKLKQKGMISQSKGYMGYKHVSCISVNDVVVHGVPSDNVIIQTGDLVKVDVCAAWKGGCADMARCFVIGQQASQDTLKFIQVAQDSLDAGIAAMKKGNHISDVSYAIQKQIEKFGYGIVRDFAGHGIGKKMHEDPDVPNYGRPGEGIVLQPGMTFAIEPMITMGSDSVYIDKDGWTAKTEDKSLAMHVEDTVLVTEGKAEILTRLS